MIEKKFVESKKQEFEINEYIKNKFGKGNVGEIKIERTPVGEKIIIFTTRPGIVIGKKGESINEINDILKKRFHLENPQIEVAEIIEPLFNAQSVADDIALSLERFGPLGFKIVAYRMLERIMRSGALGVEIVLGGKLPSERAKTWRFAQGYMKKTGENKGIVNIARATANTVPGTVGVKVSIVPKGVKIPDKIDLSNLKQEIIEIENKIEIEEKERLKMAESEAKPEEIKEKKPRKKRAKKEKTDENKDNTENKPNEEINKE